MQLQPYKHSGKFTISSVLVGLGLAAVLGVVGGFIGSYSERYIPIIYLNLLIVAGVAFLPAWGVGKTMRNLGCRNTIVALPIVLLTAVLAWYSSWVQWMVLLISEESGATFAQLFQDPKRIWRLAQYFNFDGTWSLGRGSSRENVKGVFLWVVWGAEAGLYLVLGFIAGFQSMKGVFCERCSIWIPESQTAATIACNQDEATLVNSFQRGDFESAFARAEIPEADDKGKVVSLRLQDQCCQKCRRTRAISLIKSTITVAKDGSVNDATKTVFDRLLLTDDQAGILDSLLEKHKRKVEEQLANKLPQMPAEG